MKRRAFIAGLGGAAAWSLAARAQLPSMPLLGYLSPFRPGVYAPPGFLKGLSEVGFVEGRNVAIEYHWANGDYGLYPALAADLVRRRVSAIFATSTAAALAARDATTSIPVVFALGSDPVQLGLIASLSRPGRNITGVTTLVTELGAKRLEMLHLLVPKAALIALLVNPSGRTAEADSTELLTAGRTLGIQIPVLHASNEGDFDKVFSSLTQMQAGGLVIGAGPFFNSRTELLSTLALRHSIPAIFQYREFPAAGGLISYGSDLSEAYRLAGTYAGRILKGEKAADLPVQQATKVELVINMKTARALGLTIPETLLATADEVIQ
jgi:putative tryptophan/tyrosine transport system substrate-binding protein